MMETKQIDLMDLEEIDSWYYMRNLKPICHDQLPQFGYIVPGVACGFLVQTDSANAFLEGFVTNPTVHKEFKVEAINTICQRLLKVAQELGYTHVFAMTKHPNIIAACIDNEFVSIGRYTMYFRET